MGTCLDRCTLFEPAESRSCSVAGVKGRLGRRSYSNEAGESGKSLRTDSTMLCVMTMGTCLCLRLLKAASQLTASRD